MSIPLKINFEDVATGKLTPITAPVKLSALGKIPTVRVDCDPGVTGIKFALRHNGQLVAGIPDWTDVNRPWRLAPFDKATPLPVGVSALSITPVNPQGNPLDKTTTVSLAILAETSTDAGTGSTGADTTQPPASSPLWGVTANDQDNVTALIAGLTIMAHDGGRVLRLWHGNFGELSNTNKLIITTAASLGIKVILCVQPKDGGAYNLGSPDFAGFVSKNANWLRMVEYVEAGNELNLNKYRPDDLGGDTSWYVPYVTRWLSPLSNALATIGAKCIVASVTASDTIADYATHAKGLHDAGAAQYAAGAAIHVYAHASSQYSSALTIANLPGVLTAYSATIGLPLSITETNLHSSEGSGPAFLTSAPKYLTAVRQPCVESVAWYRAVPSGNPSNNSSSRPAFDASGKPTPVYALVAAALKTA